MITNFLLAAVLTMPLPHAPAAAGATEFADPDFRAFHRVLGRNFTTNLFNAGNLDTLLVGTAATITVVPLRDDVRDALEGNAGGLGSFGDTLGGPIMLNGAAATLLLATPFTDDAKFRSFAFTIAQARILDAALKYSIKYSVSRPRPNGENENSFPSGHTSGSFTYARVIHHYYGGKAGAVAYGLAATVGISRIEMGKHFASDVVFGAMLGILAGQTAIRGTERAFGAPSYALVPIASGGRDGAMILIEF